MSRGRSIGRLAPPHPDVSAQDRAPPPPRGGREAYHGAQVGCSNPVTPEIQVDEGVLPGWDILKLLFLGDSRNGFNNLSRLAILCNACHRWHRFNTFP